MCVCVYLVIPIRGQKWVTPHPEKQTSNISNGGSGGSSSSIVFTIIIADSFSSLARIIFFSLYALVTPSSFLRWLCWWVVRWRWRSWPPPPPPLTMTTSFTGGPLCMYTGPLGPPGTWCGSTRRPSAPTATSTMITLTARSAALSQSRLPKLPTAARRETMTGMISAGILWAMWRPVTIGLPSTIGLLQWCPTCLAAATTTTSEQRSRDQRPSCLGG